MPSAEPRDAYLQAAARMGALVAARREELGLTQEQLAERAGISRNQVQNIEKNRNNTKDSETGLPGPANARLDTVFRLAIALDLGVGYLVDPAIDDPKAARRRSRARRR
ncbi:helix-turn-helix transcriptional regulator [Nocardioides sp. BGMRC 2183]|nr:helix-turn-helix transcriptional regulator [Nocardioides sp. BGMRC 2183]